MKENYTAQTVADRFTGLGSTALNQVATTDGNYLQSVNVKSVSCVAGGVQGPDGTISLTMKTVSGVTFSLLISSTGDGLSVSINASGSLSDGERTAIANLAGGFRKAIDGLSANPLKLDLSGLTQFDTSVLSSVSFQYSSSEGGSNGISASYT